MNKSLTFLVLALISLQLVSAIHEENITTTSYTGTKNAALVVTTLKYDPYPVNPADYFDVYIQVENVGESDATNVQFSLLTDYPFSDPTAQSNSFNTISGTYGATQNKASNDVTLQANKVVLKYTVRVDANAPEGTHNLQLQAIYTPTPGAAAVTHTYDIPITIQKTKTAFTVAMQEATARGTTFAIANTGDKQATAVTVTVTDPAIVTGPATAVIGNLNEGDFTTVAFQVKQGTSAVPIDITYTDTSGARSLLHYTAAVTSQPQQAPQVVTQAPKYFGVNGEWLFGIVGIVLGLIIGLIIGRRSA